MGKKKIASSGLGDSSVLRRSSGETSSRKQAVSSSVSSRKAKRIEKRTSPSSSPVKDKLEKIEKQMGSYPLRMSDRGKKMVDIPNISSRKEKTNSKHCAVYINEDKKTDQDPNVGSKKRKRLTAIRYKASFKPQRLRIESDVDKELKSQNSLRVQITPDGDHNVGKLIDLDQTEHADCSETKSLVRKSIESGDVDKKIGGIVSLSNRDTENCDNYMFHTSSCRIEHDQDNHKELDTCHKVVESQKAAGIMDNAENNDVSSNMLNSKFVEFWVPVQLSNVQLEQYCATLLSNAMALRSSSKSDTLGALKNVCISNRKCCNHPYIVDAKLQESLMKDKERSTILDVDVKASGKLQFLDHVLPEIHKQQLKVLILFQHTSGTLRDSLPLGHILVSYVHQRYGENSCEHVNGVGDISSKKQASISMFNKEMSRFIFLLESRSCNPSIKLSSVDVVIIFDSELNPSNDLKSLQKISIDSQLEQIMIFRLYSSSTLEEKILKLAENNTAIDIRSQSLRSNYDALLTWGASDLFDKLTKFHSQTVVNISSEESLLKDLVEEFLSIISHKCKSSDITPKLCIIRVQNCGIYGKNTPLHSEIRTHVPDGDQPYIFWRKLLERRPPVWKFVSESTPRQRKRPSYFFDSPPRGKNDVDGGGVKTRRRTVNINSAVEPAQLKTVTEGETGGVNEGKWVVNFFYKVIFLIKLSVYICAIVNCSLRHRYVVLGVSAANDESQSSSGDRFWSTAVNDKMSLLDLLKPTVSELCYFLMFSEDVKIIVETFLEFVLEKYQVGKEHTSTLQAFMISLCWIGSSLGKSKVDRSESFALAKKQFNFCCMEEEAESVYKKLKAVKEPFLQQTQILDRLKDNISAPEGVKPEINNNISAPEGVKPEINKSQHIHNVDAFENHESCDNHSEKGKEEFEEIKREFDEKRANLENEYKLDKYFIHALYRNNPSIRAEKLKIKDKEFAKKLEEHERLWEIHCEELKATILAAKGQVAAENEFHLHGSHSGNPEVPPTLPENPIELQINDEPVCEGANDIESTSSHTSEKEVVNATISSEQVGEVPAQQFDDDMDVDVAEKVDSSHVNAKGGTSSPDVSHAVDDPIIDHDETGANDMGLDVDSGDMKVQAEDYNKESDETRHDNVDDVAPRVECVEMRMPTGTHAVEDHNETDFDDISPHVDFGDMEMSAGNYNNENKENGTMGLDTSHVEDRYETVDKGAAEVECAETGMPAGTCDKQDAEDGEITPDVGDNHNETSPNDELLRIHSDEMTTPAGTCDRENAEEGEIAPDDGYDHNENSPNNVTCVESTDMATPAGTWDKEDGEITPDVGDDCNKTTPNDVIPRCASTDMATTAGTCEKENVEDGEITPDVGDDYNETIPNDVIPRCASTDMTVDMATTAGTCEKENVEDGEIVSDTPNVDDNHNETGLEDALPHVESVEKATPAGNEENDEDSIIRPDALHANEDHNGSNDPVCAAPSQANTPSVQPVSSPASDHIEPLQLEDLLVSGVQDEEINAGDLQPTPPVNELNMFDNLPNRLSSQMSNQTDPLQAEVERLYTVKENVAKLHQEMKQKLNSECEKEIAEIVAQIRLKYDAKHLEADAAYNKKKMEIEINIDKVNMNKILAEAFRSKCQDLTPSGHTGVQQVSQAGLMQQLSRLSSPGQSSRNQQPPQPPSSQAQPLTVPSLQTQQPRPRHPLQVVHEPAALFSSRPSPMVNQVTSSTPSTTSRPPPIINHITPSTTPTTSRPRPTSSPISPSSAPTTSRLPSGFNTINSSTLSNKSPPSIAQIDMSAANLRISTETRGQSPQLRSLVSSEPRAPAPHNRPLVSSEPRAPAPHNRPLVSSEPRAPAPHMRPLVSSEPRAPAPHMRPLISSEPRAPAPHMRPIVGNEPRAPAPHLRSTAPHIRPFRSSSPDLGTHRRMLPGQQVTNNPSQSTVIPPPSTSPQSLSPLPSEPVILPTPPPSEPCTVLASEQTPLVAHVDNAPRWVNVVAPQPDIGPQLDSFTITEFIGEGTVQSSSAHDLVCLSDDD
ncbi:hypothetical protein R6Q57_010359 [Mikania cordata]